MSVEGSVSFLPKTLVAHFVISSLTFSDHNVAGGNLSLNCFLAASQSDRYNTLTTFLLAGSSSKSPMSARTLGFCWVASLVSSVREIENFAITATWNKSTHLSHSIVGLELASCQKPGSPTRWDNDDDWIVEDESSFCARSAMLYCNWYWTQWKTMKVGMWIMLYVCCWNEFKSFNGLSLLLRSLAGTLVNVNITSCICLQTMSLLISTTMPMDLLECVLWPNKMYFS